MLRTGTIMAWLLCSGVLAGASGTDIPVRVEFGDAMDEQNVRGSRQGDPSGAAVTQLNETLKGWALAKLWHFGKEDGTPRRTLVLRINLDIMGNRIIELSAINPQKGEAKGGEAKDLKEPILKFTENPVGGAADWSALIERRLRSVLEADLKKDEKLSAVLQVLKKEFPVAEAIEESKWQGEYRKFAAVPLRVPPPDRIGNRRVTLLSGPAPDTACSQFPPATSSLPFLPILLLKNADPPPRKTLVFLGDETETCATRMSVAPEHKK